MTKWKDRVPYAYWKGNPNVAATRKNLLKCNATSKDDWNTRLYIQVLFFLINFALTFLAIHIN